MWSSSINNMFFSTANLFLLSNCSHCPQPLPLSHFTTGTSTWELSRKSGLIFHRSLFFNGLIIWLSTHFTPIYHPGHSGIFGLIWNTVFRNCISLKRKKLNSKTNRQFKKCYSWGFNTVGYRDYVGTINWIFESKNGYIWIIRVLHNTSLPISILPIFLDAKTQLIVPT